MKLHVINSFKIQGVFFFGIWISENHMYMIQRMMFLTTAYLYQIEKQIAYLPHQFNRAQKWCMLATAVDFLEDMSYRSVFALEILGFS